MWSYENILFLLPTAFSIFYAVLLQRYNIKRRRLEKTVFTIYMASVVGVVSWVLYHMYELDFKYPYVFEHLYSGSGVLDRCIAFLYAAPGLSLLMILGTITVLFRVLYGGFLSRAPFRRFLTGSMLLTPAILANYIYPGLFNTFEPILSEGSGGYPLQSSPMIVSTQVIALLAISLSITGSLIYLAMWEKRIPIFYRMASRLIDASLILLSVELVLRIYFGNIFYSRRNFLEWSTLDLLIIGFILSLLFIKDSSKLAEKRFIGVLPFSSYLSIIYTLILVLHLKMPLILNVEHAIIIEDLVVGLVSSFIFASLILGTRIFKKPFYPWLSEETQYFVRVSSSSLYLIVVLAILYMTLSLSIYFSAGKAVRPSPDYSHAVLILFILSVVIAPIVQLMVRWKKNFYLIYGVLFLFIFMSIGAKTYELYEPSPAVYLLMLIGIGVATFLFLHKREDRARGLHLYTIILLVFLILFYAAYNYSEDGVVEEIYEAGSMEAYGVSIKYLSHEIHNSTTQVYISPDNPSRVTFFVIVDVSLDVDGKRISVSRINYPAKDIIMYRGELYPQGTYMLKIAMGRFAVGASPKIDISVYRYGWSTYYYYIWPILLAVAFYLYDKDELIIKK
jgi:hypothetical protein